MADGSSTSPNKETVTLRLPSGEMVDAIVPAGFSDEDLKSYVRMKQPDLFGAPAGIQKPQVNMQTGAAPIATSFATQLSNLPRNLWEGSFFGELGNPRVRAEHEQRIKAMEAPGMEGIKNTFQAANPIVSNESGVDYGATAANLLPYLLSAKGLRTPEVNTSDALAAAKATGKLAVKAAASKVPAAGWLVQRPSLMDFVKALQTKATQAEPPPRVSPPPITGFKGPYEPDATTEIPASKVSTTPPKPSPVTPSKSARLAQLRSIAQQPGTGVVTPEPSGPQTLFKGQPIAANTDLTSALTESIPAKTALAVGEQRALQGKIMQIARNEKTVGPEGTNYLTVSVDRLMRSPEFKGYTREQVVEAARNLRDSAKVHGHYEGDPNNIVAVAVKKKAK